MGLWWNEDIMVEEAETLVRNDLVGWIERVGSLATLDSPDEGLIKAFTDGFDKRPAGDYLELFTELLDVGRRTIGNQDVERQTWLPLVETCYNRIKLSCRGNKVLMEKVIKRYLDDREQESKQYPSFANAIRDLGGKYPKSEVFGELALFFPPAPQVKAA